MPKTLVKVRDGYMLFDGPRTYGAGAIVEVEDSILATQALKWDRYEEEIKARPMGDDAVDGDNTGGDDADETNDEGVGENSPPQSGGKVGKMGARNASMTTKDKQVRTK